MNILNLFNALPQLASTIDQVTTSDEERGKLKLELIRQQMKLAERLVEADVKIVEAQARIVTTEAGGSGLKASWRPIAALTFTGLITYKVAVEPFCVAFIANFPIIEVPGWVGASLTALFGGYVVSRGGEKIVEMLTRYDPDIFEKAKNRIKLAKQK